ncbi:hypothetical protein G6F23_015263 [Rhizopus arrhizus]|nr:hypothetical protein G6F23_015263 [Rhizopus arrhizus]
MVTGVQTGALPISPGIRHQLVRRPFDGARRIVVSGPNGEDGARGNGFVDIPRGDGLQPPGQYPSAVAPAGRRHHAGAAQCRHGSAHHNLVRMQHLGQRPRRCRAAAQMHVDQDMQQSGKASVIGHGFELP